MLGVQQIGRAVVRHGPTIMTVAGIAGVVGGGVLACKATIKAEEIMAEHQSNAEAVRESGYSIEEEYNEAITKVYIHTAKELLKAYGPALILTGVSISSILYGHRVLCVRNVMLAGAYKALTMDYDEYRKRVQDKIGYDEEVKIRHNIQKIDVKNLETGEMDYLEYVLSDDPCAWNARSKFFCESSIYWTEDPEANLNFLREVEKDMQKLFNKKGYLFLNTVYKALDIPETYAGSVCGWIKGLGDNKIDFGLYNMDHEGVRRFINGYEAVVLLDFNDDGYIADKI